VEPINVTGIPSPTNASTFFQSAFPTETPIASNATSNGPSNVTSETPSASSSEPTPFPSQFPSEFPSSFPSQFPSDFPSSFPSQFPLNAPSNAPSNDPSATPSSAPTQSPSMEPTQSPTKSPSSMPTRTPSFRPTAITSAAPSELPTGLPTGFPTGFPTEQPTESSAEPTLSRFTALGNAISSNYPDRSFDFGPTTNEYVALELLANSDPGLVPAPDPNDETSSYLLLQRYVLVLLYLSTTGDMWGAGRWLQGQAGEMTCDWSGVTCLDGSSIETLNRTYSTVQTEPAICLTRRSLTAVLFSKSGWQQPFRKPTYGNWISDDNFKFVFV
jgi:hypothetical protein